MRVGVWAHTEADVKSAYNNVGPNTEDFEEILQTMQVGTTNKFCENIISVPLPKWYGIG